MPYRTPRVVGIDIARGLAILGMFVAHAIPRADDGELLVDGRSSILFATLAGISLGIITGGARPVDADQRSSRRQQILLRALILFVLGVGLSTLGSGIAIILDYYALMFLGLIPLLFVPRRVLVVIALVLAFAAPALARFVGDERPDLDPLRYLTQLYLLTGYYPALIWIPFLIAGLICVRSDLTAPRTQVLMMGLGAAASVFGYGAAAILPGVTAEEHSGSTAEVFGSGGLAIAIVGALLWVTAVERRAVGRVLRGIAWPLAATGSMALTIYTLQIVTLAIASDLRDSAGLIDYPGWPLLIGMTVASIAFASLWRRLLGNGPLERLMTVMTHVARPKHPESSVTTGTGDTR